MGVGTGGVAYATEFLVCRMHFPHDCDYERVRIEPTTSSLPKWSNLRPRRSSGSNSSFYVNRFCTYACWESNQNRIDKYTFLSDQIGFYYLAYTLFG